MKRKEILWSILLNQSTNQAMTVEESDRIIEMAWEDRTPFEAIKAQFGFSEAEVIALMRKELKQSSFKMWRKRVNSGVSRKHLFKALSRNRSFQK
jgi:uncharacterized protein (TIGR03643 family)